MLDLKGRAAVVTGAAGGIGFALARRLAAEGMSLAITDVDAEGLASAEVGLRDRGATVLALASDIANHESLGAFASAALDRLGPPTVLCANAGVAGPWEGAPWEISDEDWRRVFGVNVFGVVDTVRAFLPAMVASGDTAHVVVTASMASFITNFVAAPYTASKHAAMSFAESTRMTLEAQGSPIGVSVLCPDRVRTRILEREAARTLPDEAAQAMTDAVFSGDGVAHADDVAERVLDGVQRGDFFLFSHDKSLAEVHELSAALVARLPG